MIWILNHFPFKTAFHFAFHSSFEGYIIYVLEIGPPSILKPRFYSLFLSAFTLLIVSSSRKNAFQSTVVQAGEVCVRI